MKIIKKINNKNLIFSSAAIVYNDANVSYKESSQTCIDITNSYRKSKYIQKKFKVCK